MGVAGHFAMCEDYATSLSFDRIQSARNGVHRHNQDITLSIHHHLLLPDHLAIETLRSSDYRPARFGDIEIAKVLSANAETKCCVTLSTKRRTRIFGLRRNGRFCGRGA
jgi:hypothetical protein